MRSGCSLPRTLFDKSMPDMFDVMHRCRSVHTPTGLRVCFGFTLMRSRVCRGGLLMLVLTHRETNDHVVVNAGRRGTKRKADAVQEEKLAAELKEEKEEVEESASGGRRVIIEHW